MLSNRPKKRVIILDRDKEIREAITLFLKDTYDVYGFSSIGVLNKKIHPHIIILDILPIMHTKEITKVIHKIRFLYRNIPILVISTSKNALQKARLVGIREFLEKPFDIDRFQQKVYRLS